MGNIINNSNYILTRFERHEEISRADSAEVFGNVACGFLQYTFGCTVAVSLKKPESEALCTFAQPNPTLIQRICSIALFILTLPISLPLTIAGVIALYCSQSYANLFQKVFESQSIGKSQGSKLDALDSTLNDTTINDTALKIDDVDGKLEFLELSDLLPPDIETAAQMLDWAEKNLEKCKLITDAELSFKDITDGELKKFILMCPNLSFLSIESENIENVDVLPTGLETFDCSNCINLQKLASLPSKLKTLNCNGCVKLETLPALPTTLEALDCSGCEKLETLPALPPLLEALDCSCCDNLKALPVLPPSLYSLTFSQCYNLHSLPTLPLELELLDCTNCTKLKWLPALPPSIKTLYHNGVSLNEESYLKAAKSKWDVISFKKTNLNFGEAEEDLKISELKDFLPHNIKTVSQLLSWTGNHPQTCKLITHADLMDFTDIEDDELLDFIDMCPNLSHLFISSNYIEELEYLPEKLQTLKLNSCANLKALPPLPQTLLELHLAECTFLQSLPTLPLELKVLSCINCPQLEEPPKLPEGLQELNYN